MKTKLLILDRDGVLNIAPSEEQIYITKIDDFLLNYDFISKLRHINRELPICVISNQQGVAKRLIEISTISSFETLIQKELSRFEIQITKFYYCFHLQETGCECRKPKIGNFLKAMNDFEVSYKECLYIGDQESDEISARNANIKFFYVNDISTQLIASL